MTLQYHNQPKDFHQHVTALYSLEYIGMGTAYTESLTSYIQRLSNSHCVKPGDLIKEMLIPPLGKEYLLNRQATTFFENAHSLNSIIGLSQQISDVIADLTGRPDIHRMTMATWSNILHDTGLIKKNQSWCPKCYQEWRNQDKQIYQPLLWFLKPVQICDIHNLLLEEECPHCHKIIPVLS